MDLREKLIYLILRTPGVAVSSRAAAEHIADHLIENGSDIFRRMPGPCYTLDAASKPPRGGKRR